MTKLWPAKYRQIIRNKKDSYILQIANTNIRAIN